MALERFDAAGPGGTFKYRNRALQRWSDAEVARLAQGGIACAGGVV